MIKNQRGNSIIEVVVVIVILSVGIIGAYGILDGGQKLATTSENRIKAINIAREGMEAVENIRDTNWIKFSSDYDNCWKVKDYDTSCIGNTGKNFQNGSYLLIQSGSLWYLSGAISLGVSSYIDYLSTFPIYLDNNGLSTSSGSYTTPCSSTITTNCKTIFTREIQINNPDNDHLKINNIVTWVDSTKTSGPHIINLETVLTNWKKKF